MDFVLALLSSLESACVAGNEERRGLILLRGSWPRIHGNTQGPRLEKPPLSWSVSSHVVSMAPGVGEGQLQVPRALADLEAIGSSWIRSQVQGPNLPGREASGDYFPVCLGGLL